MPVESKYSLVIDNVSNATRTNDLWKECEYFGTVYEIEVDRPTRSAIVEFKRSDDADEAWRKLHGTHMDGRRWKVDWATPADFRFFGWKWNEGGLDKNRKARSLSRSRSPSRSPSSRRREVPDRSGSPSSD